MQAKEYLTIKAAILARTAPNEWREFLSALGQFTEHHRENLVSSPLADLPINQGRAQILGALLKNMENCTKDADELARKARTK